MSSESQSNVRADAPANSKPSSRALGPRIDKLEIEVRQNRRLSWASTTISALLVVVTLALVITGYLHYEIFSSQAELQEKASRANIAPRHDGIRIGTTVVIRMVNSGLTPARAVRINWDRFLLAMPSIDELDSRCPTTTVDDSGYTIHAGHDLEANVSDRNAPPDLPSGDQILFVCGIIRYNDDFQKERRTHFCFQWDAAQWLSGTDFTVCTLRAEDI